MYLGDPEDDFVLRSVHTRFPDHKSLEHTKEKVTNTADRLESLFGRVSSEEAQLAIYYCNQPPNYSATIIDREAVILSVYEQYRHTKIDSCAITIDIRDSEHLQAYWDKELDGFHNNSREALVRPTPA